MLVNNHMLMWHIFQELNGRNIHVSYAIAGGYRGDGVSVKKLIMECKHLFVDKSM